VLVGAITIAWAMGLTDYLDLNRFVMARGSLREAVGTQPVTAALTYVAAYAVVVSLSLPGALVMTIAGGFLFGGWTGGALAVIGATIGAVVVFVAARTALADWLRAKAGPFLGKLRDGFADNALSYLLFLRLVPVFPFWLVNLAPALLDVRLSTYVLATMIGIIPGTIAFAFVGAGLDSVIAAQVAADPNCAAGITCRIQLDPQVLVTRELLFALAGLGIVALIPVALKALRRR
jgi:uncharacterized membrane protein YdjX (TVP38/TMEM64 family)